MVVLSDALIQKMYSIATNVNGSENSQVNIPGLEDYVMPVPEEECYLETS